MKKLLVLAFAAALVVPSQAATLWSQTDYTLNGLVDQEFSDFPTFSSYLAQDVTFGSAVTVTSVSTLIGAFTNQAGFLANTTNARLAVFAKTGTLPGAGDDPSTAGSLVGVTLTQFNVTDNIWEMKAGGLNMNLAAGSYWFVLSPNAAFGTSGQAFHFTTNSQVGDPTAFRNPGGGFGLGSGWQDAAAISGASGDTTLIIEGDAVPEPATMIALGAGALALIRRRRSK